MWTLKKQMLSDKKVRTIIRTYLRQPPLSESDVQEMEVIQTVPDDAVVEATTEDIEE